LLIDTNVILRYLLEDDKESFEIASRLISDGASTLPETIPELIYVLTKVYSIDRITAADAVLSVLEDVDVENVKSIKSALELFRKTGLDYVDCRYAVLAIENRYDVFRFDKKLVSFIRNGR
jgi:predicted nucleic-acid-binding protein